MELSREIISGIILPAAFIVAVLLAFAYSAADVLMEWIRHRRRMNIEKIIHHLSIKKYEIPEAVEKLSDSISAFHFFNLPSEDVTVRMLHYLKTYQAKEMKKPNSDNDDLLTTIFQIRTHLENEAPYNQLPVNERKPFDELRSELADNKSCERLLRQIAENILLKNQEKGIFVHKTARANRWTFISMWIAIVSLIYAVLID